MRIDLDGVAGLSIDKSKVLVVLRGTQCDVDFEVTNHTNEDITVSVGQRTPDFVEEGFVVATDQKSIMVVYQDESYVISAMNSVKQVIHITKTGSMQDTEAWVTVMGDNGGRVRLELVLRLLITSGKVEPSNMR